MEIFYTSMYLQDKIHSFEQLTEKFDPAILELVLDANLCIYMRDFYREPNSIVARKDGTWEKLKKLLFNINHYDLLVDYSLGAEEACRNLSDFSINDGKLNEMVECINALFSMDYFEVLKHSQLVKYEPPKKDITERQTSKMDSLEQISSFQSLLFLSYACMLKIYCLNKFDKTLSNLDKMLRFLQFLEDDVDILSASHIVFANFLFGGNALIKKVIHKTQNTEGLVLHALWNAAIDLTFPILASNHFARNKTLPIFVTCDERLWYIFNAMKFRLVFANKDRFGHPPLLEYDFTDANWTDEERKQLYNYHSKVVSRRKYRSILNPIDVDKQLNKLRVLCYSLEKDLKLKMINII